MKTTLLCLALVAPAAFTFCQEALPAQAVVPPPELKPEQKANVLKQLEELERTILASRGTSLSSIIQRLRSAASSDAAAMGLLEDCDKLVNVERKSSDRDAKDAAERRAEAQKRQQSNTTKADEEKNGDAVLALRLSLEYLALTLEANEAKDIQTMIPKLEAYHKTLLASAEKLKGNAGESLTSPISSGGGGGGRRAGGGNVGDGVGLVIKAFQLTEYLSPKDWSAVPGDVVGHYSKLMLKVAREKKGDVAGLWDAAINNEAAFRKARMFEGEYAIWLQNELPALRWQRAQDMVGFTATPVNGLAEMLNVIKAHPNHPSSPKWVSALRGMVESAPAQTAPAPGS